jgi:hypothetical protein
MEISQDSLLSIAGRRSRSDAVVEEGVGEEGRRTTHSRICALSELLQLLERTGVSFAVHLDGDVSCYSLLATEQLFCLDPGESIQ